MDFSKSDEGMETLDTAITNLLSLSHNKRDALMNIRASLQDVEGYDASDTSKVKFIHRSNVLPLPNSYEEAADWGSRYLKGVRVYTMYPSTTSLYPATTT